jgi:hypothetical protein
MMFIIQVLQWIINLLLAILNFPFKKHVPVLVEVNELNDGKFIKKVKQPRPRKIPCCASCGCLMTSVASKAPGPSKRSLDSLIDEEAYNVPASEPNEHPKPGSVIKVPSIFNATIPLNSDKSLKTEEKEDAVEELKQVDAVDEAVEESQGLHLKELLC